MKKELPEVIAREFESIIHDICVKRGFDFANFMLRVRWRFNNPQNYFTVSMLFDCYYREGTIHPGYYHHRSVEADSTARLGCSCGGSESGSESGSECRVGQQTT